MNFAFSEEQEELRRAVRQFLESKSPETEVRRLMETTEGYDPAVWKQMGQELMLQGLAIPEEYGGQGFTFIELGIVLEEMGRVLLCAPYFSSVVLAANAILDAGTDEEKQALLPGIASGDTIADARRSPSRRGSGTRPASRWRRRRPGDGYTLTGEKMFVHRRARRRPDRRRGAHRGHDRHRRHLVLHGRRRRRRPHAHARCRRWTRRASRRSSSSTTSRPTPLGAPGSGWPAFSKMLDQAAVALANEMMGGAQKVLEMSVEYAKVRVQFGRPIGSFQAIKHKCADMLLEVESGKSAAYYASWAAAEDNDELPVVAALSKAYCSEAYFHAAAENIQIHGGIGFTWEHPAHLYFKRAKSSEIYLGDPTYHRELLAQRIGI